MVRLGKTVDQLTALSEHLNIVGFHKRFLMCYGQPANCTDFFKLPRLD